MFGIGPEVRALEAIHHDLAPLYAVKRLFVQTQGHERPQGGRPPPLSTEMHCDNEIEARLDASR